jgi:hypothetical protein
METDLDRLLALELPVGVISVRDFGWLLDLPFWREDGVWFRVTPREVKEHPVGHAAHWERTLATNLASPVHVVERDGREVIIDGIHRLLNASVQGVETLPARRVPPGMLTQIATG